MRIKKKRQKRIQYIRFNNRLPESETGRKRRGVYRVYRFAGIAAASMALFGVVQFSDIWMPAMEEILTPLAAVSSFLSLPDGTLAMAEKYYDREYNDFGDDFWEDADTSAYYYEKIDVSDIVYEESNEESSEESSETIRNESELVFESSTPELWENIDDLPTITEVAQEDRGKIIEETFLAVASSRNILFGKGFIKNDTELSNETVEEILDKKMKLVLDATNEPQVLIMHTHATESFEPTDRLFYDKNDTYRTTDNQYNMVRVGEELVKVLQEAGIVTVQDATQHDYPAYNGAYDRSAETVEAWLERYPSIKVVIDLHRDAIERDGKVRVKPVTTINGQKAAQLMIIAGCDDGTMDMPNWKENLRFAAALQDQLETKYPTLTRPVFFCYRRYNQHLTTGSLLIEVGGHSNSLEQAIYSARLLGECMAELLAPQTSETE